MEDLPSGTPVWQSGWGLYARNHEGEPAYLPDKVRLFSLNVNGVHAVCRDLFCLKRGVNCLQLQYGIYYSLTTKECQRYWGNCYVNDQKRQFCALGPDGQQDRVRMIFVIMIHKIKKFMIFNDFDFRFSN